LRTGDWLSDWRCALHRCQGGQCCRGGLISAFACDVPDRRPVSCLEFWRRLLQRRGCQCLSYCKQDSWLLLARLRFVLGRPHEGKSSAVPARLAEPPARVKGGLQAPRVTCGVVHDFAAPAFRTSDTVRQWFFHNACVKFKKGRPSMMCLQLGVAFRLLAFGEPNDGRPRLLLLLWGISPRWASSSPGTDAVGIATALHSAPSDAIPGLPSDAKALQPIKRRT
jgi:hypothetical protein